MAKVVDFDFNDPVSAGSAEDTAGPTLEEGKFIGGAGTDGRGNAVFDGKTGYLEVAPSESLGLEKGTIAMSFVQNSPSSGDDPSSWENAAQTLFSVDSMNLDAGGHLTVYIDSNGRLMVRHQTESSSVAFGGGTIKPGAAVEMAYSWGPDGSVLVLNGQTIAEVSAPFSLAGDVEPMLLGVAQTRSGDGVADRVQGHFDGMISQFRMYDTTISEAGGVPCFAAGTLVETPCGPREVERLAPGDLVLTLDAGARPVTRVLRSAFGAADLAARPSLRPVVIARGVLGATADLTVSRQHCLAVETPQGPRLARAGQLARRLPGLRVAEGRRRVTYVHLLFERHHVIIANGIAAETLYLGPSVRAARPDLACLPEMERALPLARLRSVPSVRSAPGHLRPLSGLPNARP